MRILFAIDSLSGGGAERVISALANYMVSTNACQAGIALLFANNIEYQVSENVPIYSINGNLLQHRLTEKKNNPQNKPCANSTRRTDFLNNIKSGISELRDVRRRAKKLAELVEREKYDTVISFLTNSNEVACKAKRFMSAKVFISERSDPNSTVLSSKHSGSLMKTYNRADKIVFQTDYAMNSYPQFLKKKSTIIPNPIMNGLPDPYTGERKKRIVNFARLTRQKNIPLLINSFMEVQKTHPEYELDIFGKGEVRADLERFIDENNLGGKVHLYDFKENIHDIIKDYAMFVSSSNYEGISNSMIEALALGLPCVCTDCPAGGARMAIKSGENGLLVPINDKEALTEAIICIIEDPALAERFSKNAILIREKWSIDKIVEKWMNIIAD